MQTYVEEKGGKTERDRSSIWWFTAQTASQSLAIPKPAANILSESPVWIQGHKLLGHLQLPLQVDQCKAGLEVKQPVLKSMEGHSTG